MTELFDWQLERRDARARVNNGLRDGRIERPRHCAICGRPVRLEAHHADYAKPDSVTWLCHGCHFVADRLREEKAEVGYTQKANCPEDDIER